MFLLEHNEKKRAARRSQSSCSTLVKKGTRADAAEAAVRVIHPYILMAATVSSYRGAAIGGCRISCWDFDPTLSRLRRYLGYHIIRRILITHTKPFITLFGLPARGSKK